MLAKQSVAVGVVALVCLLGMSVAASAAAQPGAAGQPPPVPPSPQNPALPDPGQPTAPPGGADPVEPPAPPDGADPVEPAAPPDGAEPVPPTAPPDGPDPVEPAAPPGGADPVQPVDPTPDPPSGSDTSELLAAEEGLLPTLEQRRLIQWGLTQAGFDPGPKDGQFGPSTRSAIRRWQTENRQDSTGYLAADDVLRLERLGRMAWDAEQARVQEADARRQAEAFRDNARNDAATAVQQAQQAQRQREADRARYVRWIIISVAGAAVVLLVLWVVGSRSVSRAKQRRDRAEMLAQAARSDLADRAARDRAAEAVPAVFLDGADPAGRPLAVRVPGNAIAEAEGAVVGRNPFDATVVIDHPEVSRRHFRLFADGASVLVEDLNSMNGTKLNDVALSPGAGAPLLAGAVLQVGELSFTVTLQG